MRRPTRKFLKNFTATLRVKAQEFFSVSSNGVSAGSISPAAPTCGVYAFSLALLPFFLTRDSPVPQSDASRAPSGQPVFSIPDLSLPAYTFSANPGVRKIRDSSWISPLSDRKKGSKISEGIAYSSTGLLPTLRIPETSSLIWFTFKPPSCVTRVPGRSGFSGMSGSHRSGSKGTWPS